MNRKIAIGALALTVLAALACNPLSGVVGGSGAGTAANLWPDVPAYPGANKTDLELPLFVRLAVEAASRAIMAGAGDSAGDLEFISYSSDDRNVSGVPCQLKATIGRSATKPRWAARAGPLPAKTSGACARSARSAAMKFPLCSSSSCPAPKAERPTCSTFASTPTPTRSRRLPPSSLRQGKTGKRPAAYRRGHFVVLPKLLSQSRNSLR